MCSRIVKCSILAYRNIPIWKARCWDTFDGASISHNSVRHGGAYRLLLTHDCLSKPKPVKPVVVDAHGDLEQRMSCLNNVFVYGFRKVRISRARRFYCVGALLFCDNSQTIWRALLLDRALPNGTLRHVVLALRMHCINPNIPYHLI